MEAKRKKPIVESEGFLLIGFCLAAICFLVAIYEYVKGLQKDWLNEAFPLVTINALFLIYFGVGIQRVLAKRGENPKKPKGD